MTPLSIYTKLCLFEQRSCSFVLYVCDERLCCVCEVMPLSELNVSVKTEDTQAVSKKRVEVEKKGEGTGT